MSEVYHARDRASGAQVVLKIPHSYLIGDLSSFSRFQREVEIGRRLEHPNVQRLLGTGQLDNGHTPYIVMEYVEGLSLRSYLDAHKVLPVEEAVGIARQIVDALGYCHHQGVVHRDLKPENVLITPDGRVKLTDFGIALLQGARRVTWGSLSSTVGTPDYMAPEQVRGDRGDERTDVYAVGVMLYEMLTGEVPFQGDSPLAVMSQRVQRDPPPVNALRPDVPDALAVVVERALRRDPAERYASMVAFGHDLAHLDEVDVASYHWSQRGTSGLPGRLVTWAVVVGTLLALALLGLVGELIHRAQMAH
jgi:serine/threonine-protein kinase